MKRVTFIVFVLVMVLATCKAPEPKAPVPTVAPATEPAVPPTPTETLLPEPKLPAASFDAQTYVNAQAGFALEYPTGWTVDEAVVGDRGTQILFVSSPELAEAATLPEGATRLSATIYQWNPKNDLAAYVAHWKSAWESSGFTILNEQSLTLEQGLPVVEFTIQTPDMQSVFLVTALKDQYLVLAGEGDLNLVKEIVERLRPISK
jgi:hypothetical protein